MPDWDDDIAALKLSDTEKNGLQVFRNYSRAFEQRRVSAAREAALELTFDLASFRGDLEALVEAPQEVALLAACSIADDLLKGMFKRLEKPGLKVAEMVGPLGPLSDLNRRLKVAALADLIDADDFLFFDDVRKLRNKIAHGRRVKPPSPDQLAAVIDRSPAWLLAIVPEHVATSSMQAEKVVSLFKAGTAIHLGKLALNTLLGPLAKSMRVEVHQLIAGPSSVALELSGIGMEHAVKILERDLELETNFRNPAKINR